MSCTISCNLNINLLKRQFIQQILCQRRKKKQNLQIWLYLNLLLIPKNRDGNTTKIILFRSLYFWRSRDIQPFSNVFTFLSHRIISLNMSHKELLCSHFITKSSPNTESPSWNNHIDLLILLMKSARNEFLILLEFSVWNDSLKMVCFGIRLFTAAIYVDLYKVF